jgi:hypothetical protein
MNFKKWIEHIDDLYPEPGDFVMVIEPIWGQGMKEISPGNYMCVNKDDDAEIYKFKHLASGKTYSINYTDFDEDVNAGKIKLD